MMKSRFCIRALLSVALLLALIAVLCACGVGLGDDVQGDSEVRAAYNDYAERIAASGETPLTYDAWLSMIKGETVMLGLE